MSTQLAERKSESPAARQQEYLRPLYEVDGNENSYEIKVYMPGVPRDQASITLEKNTLVVEGRRFPHWSEGWRPLHREIPVGDYRLRLQLNVQVDESRIKASTRDGVLQIQLPVAEEAKPRSIKIN